MGAFSLTKNIDHLYDTKNLHSAMLFVTFKRHAFCGIAERLGEVSFRWRSGRIVILHRGQMIGRGRTARKAMDNAVLRLTTPAARRSATSARRLIA